MSDKINELFYGFAEPQHRKSTRVTIRLSRKEYEKLCQYAAKFGRSPSQFLREALHFKIEWLETKDKAG